MSRIVKGILAANLIVLAILAFVYPQFMVAPGKLIPGHQQLEGDCFACHRPLLGSDAARCTACHKPVDIGRLTSTGLPLSKPLTTTPFHQQLLSQDCVACHSDHAGVKRFQPQEHFKHALLRESVRQQCESCHKAPADSVHKQITGNCSQCHQQVKWLPASFAHDQYFLLDRDHNVPCVNCHPRNDYSRYTCYGCHEHSPANVRREHIKEGIRDFDNCVECHRSADEHDIKGYRSEERRRQENRHGRKKNDH